MLLCPQESNNLVVGSNSMDLLLTTVMIDLFSLNGYYYWVEKNESWKNVHGLVHLYAFFSNLA